MVQVIFKIILLGRSGTILAILGFYWVSSFVAFPQLVQAQVSCRSEISFKLKRGETESEIHFSAIERSGADEEESKKALLDYSNREKAQAMERCRSLYENLSGCIAARFSSHSNVMANSTFAARRALEQAINNDCVAAQGKCISASSSEPVCKASAPAAAAASTDKEPAEEKKDAKKKK